MGNGTRAARIGTRPPKCRTVNRPSLIVQHHNLVLAKSGNVEFCGARVGTGAAMFTTAEMRHDFAIWTRNHNRDTGRQRYLYYCIRCKQAFSVSDRSESVTPLDSEGNALQGVEALKRLETFSCGPCAAFIGLPAPRFMSKLMPIQTTQSRLSHLTSVGRRALVAMARLHH